MDTLEASQSLTRAAQDLTQAKKNYAELRRSFTPGATEGAGAELMNSWLAMNQAYAAYTTQYRQYTNPFGVKKTFS